MYSKVLFRLPGKVWFSVHAEWNQIAVLWSEQSQIPLNMVLEIRFLDGLKPPLKGSCIPLGQMHTPTHTPMGFDCPWRHSPWPETQWARAECTIGYVSCNVVEQTNSSSWTVKETLWFLSSVCGGDSSIQAKLQDTYSNRCLSVTMILSLHATLDDTSTLTPLLQHPVSWVSNVAPVWTEPDLIRTRVDDPQNWIWEEILLESRSTEIWIQSE